MARYNYERLSSQDNSFLLFEQGNVRMHVSSTNVLDVGPLKTGKRGGVDIELIKDAMASVLHLVPRYRQRLFQIPLYSHAVWVDDPHFDLNFHVRHTALPQPGTLDQLKRLSARIMAQPLDRKRPLWETWIVEGLEGGKQFAMVTKIHHCMIDGASGVDLAQIQFSVSPETEELPPPQTFRPRPAPSRAELLADETRRQASIPFEIISDFRKFVRDTADLRDEVSTRVNALTRLFGAGMRADETPVNGKVGPHRHIDWFSCRLDDLKAIRKGFGCSINDVVLTVVTGGIRRYFTARGVDVDEIDFKVSTPVSVRRKEHEGQMGNHVSSWIIRLPIDKADPKSQLEEINEITEELKETNQAIGVQMMNQIQAWTPSVLLSLGAQAMSGPINMICTNVPGPQIPLYFHGARILAIYPMVPLMEGQGLGVALTSYAGIMNIGFNSDPDLVPDLDFFIEGMIQSLEDVAEAAGVELGPVSSDPRALMEK